MVLKKYRISAEVLKYPYNGTILESDEALSEKVFLKYIKKSV
jgi:hypothetical protein